MMMSNHNYITGGLPLPQLHPTGVPSPDASPLTLLRVGLAWLPPAGVVGMYPLSGCFPCFLRIPSAMESLPSSSPSRPSWEGCSATPEPASGCFPGDCVCVRPLAP
jgi:hypothetical protein